MSEFEISCPEVKNLFTLDDLSDSQIFELIKLAERMEPFANQRLIPPWAPSRGQIPFGYPVGTRSAPITAKYESHEATTRTLLTMVQAAIFLGLQPVFIMDTKNTSIAKGEGPAHNDMMIACAQRPDIYALRTRTEGAARYAAETIANYHRIAGFSQPLEIPVINLGDGCHGHPTQGLGDVWYLKKRFGLEFPKKRVGVVGGSNLSRTSAEMLRASKIFGFPVMLFCRADALPPENWLKGVEWAHCPTWDGIQECDVIYWIRPQDERFKGDQLAFQRMMREITLNASVARQLKPNVFHMHAQPIKDHGDLIPVFPDMYGRTEFASIQQQSDLMVAMRMAVLTTVWANRHLPTIIPKAEEPEVPPIVEMSMAEKQQRLQEKNAGKDLFFQPIGRGLIFDHCQTEEGDLIYDWLVYLGLIDRRQPGIKAAIGPMRTDRPGFDGVKSVVVLEGMFLAKAICAAFQLLFPAMTFSFCDQKPGLFEKYVFPAPKRIPAGILPCPNPDCITNNCAQAKARHQVYDGRIICDFCERTFRPPEVVAKISEIVGPTKVRGLLG
jgi:aspartate carbamoyltransferase catalytic subunit